jgi:hypothetical protein
MRLMGFAVFWDLTPCSLVDVYQWFGGTHCSHFQVEEQATHTREHEKEEPRIDQIKTCSLDKKRPNV